MLSIALVVGAGAGAVCAGTSRSSVAETPAPTATAIEGSDLVIELPSGWQVTPKQQTATELRALVDAFPEFAAQQGLHASDTDEQIVRAWATAAKECVLVAFNPADGDTSSIFVYPGPFWSSLAQWRAQEKSNARALPGKLLSVASSKVGTHRTLTSLIRTSDPKLLLATEAIEQADGGYVIVSTTLDADQVKLAKRIFASVRVA